MKIPGFTLLFFLFALSSCSVFLNGDEGSVSIPYPEPGPRADSAKVFLPDVVSTDGNEFGSAFSPDGRKFYFARSKNGKSGIYLTTFDGTRWMEPAMLALADTSYAFADPAFDKAGNLFFISTMPVDSSDHIPDFDVWMVSPTADGKWEIPQNIYAVNSDSNEFYISFSGKGDMYFSSSRAGGFGSEDIYVSEWKSNEYREPRNLGPAVNTENSEYDPGISTGVGPHGSGELIVFTSTGRDDSFGKGDLYATAIVNGAWNNAVHLDSVFNTGGREFCSFFSPDGKYFFFSCDGDIKWIDSDAILEK